MLVRQNKPDEHNPWASIKIIEPMIPETLIVKTT